MTTRTKDRFFKIPIDDAEYLESFNRHRYGLNATADLDEVGMAGIADQTGRALTSEDETLVEMLVRL